MVKHKTEEAQGFWESLFSSLHHARRTAEPERYPDQDFRGAIQTILDISGMTVEQLATRLELMTNTLRTIQLNNNPKPELLKRLSVIAAEFDLPVMSEWFTMEADLAINRKGKQKYIRNKAG